MVNTNTVVLGFRGVENTGICCVFCSESLQEHENTSYVAFLTTKRMRKKLCSHMVARCTEATPPIAPPPPTTITTNNQHQHQHQHQQHQQHQQQHQQHHHHHQQQQQQQKTEQAGDILHNNNIPWGIAGVRSPTMINLNVARYKWG